MNNYGEKNAWNNHKQIIAEKLEEKLLHDVSEIKKKGKKYIYKCRIDRDINKGVKR